MLSGILIKATGVYVLARISFNVFGASGPASTLFIGLGMASMLVGVFLAVGQWDFKRLLAYHSISQMGYVVLALGVGLEAMSKGSHTVGALAVFGGLFHMMNHAIFKSLLFLCSGSVAYGTGTRDLHKLGGMGRKMPLTNSSGSRTRFESSMMFDGLLAGGAARSTPSDAKLIAPSTIPQTSRPHAPTAASVSAKPRKIGTTDRHAPNTSPLSTSPASIAERATGVEISRS